MSCQLAGWLPFLFLVFIIKLRYMQTNKLTIEDLQAISDLLDKQTAVLATKEKLRSEIKGLEDRFTGKMDDMERNLKTYIEEGIETVMTGMDNLGKTYADKETQNKLVDWSKEAGEKIGVKPQF